MARDFTVEWSLGKPQEFFAELWNVEAMVLAILEAAAFKNEELAGMVNALAQEERNHQSQHGNTR